MCRSLSRRLGGRLGRGLREERSGSTEEREDADAEAVWLAVAARRAMRVESCHQTQGNERKSGEMNDSVFRLDCISARKSDNV